MLSIHYYHSLVHSLLIVLIAHYPYAHSHQQQQYGMPQAQAQSYQQGVQYQQQQGHHHQAVPGQVPHYQQAPVAGNVLHDQARIHDREHMTEHMPQGINQEDVQKMSEEELQFHYFKMHDNDQNNKLDGSELIKSLIHWHVEESKHLGQNAPPAGTTKIFTDDELANMIDPIFDMDDKNKDGYIDYPEFVAAQNRRVAANVQK